MPWKKHLKHLKVRTAIKWKTQNRKKHLEHYFLKMINNNKNKEFTLPLLKCKTIDDIFSTEGIKFTDGIGKIS